VAYCLSFSAHVKPALTTSDSTIPTTIDPRSHTVGDINTGIDCHICACLRDKPTKCSTWSTAHLYQPTFHYCTICVASTTGAYGPHRIIPATPDFPRHFFIKYRCPIFV